MSIKAIEESPGKSKRSYATGHVYLCCGCNLWVRWLGDNELCACCHKSNGIKRTIQMYGMTPQKQQNNI